MKKTKALGQLATLLLAVWLGGCAAAQQTQEQLAAHYFGQGDYAQAAQLYESLYKRAPQKFYYQRLLAVYAEMGDYREAMRLVERRQKNNPKDLSLIVDEGNLHLKQNQPKKAQKSFERAIAAIGNNLQPIPDLVQAFVGIGQTDYALKCYRRVRETTKNPYAYFSETVGLLQQKGDYAGMTDEYFNLLDHQPGMLQSVQVSMQHALAEAPDERLSQGIRTALVSRVQEQPGNRTYTEMMIWYALQVRDFGFAATQARAIDARFPDEGAAPLLRVARISQQNGAYAVADECYKALIAKGKDHPYYFDARVGELEVAFSQVNNNYQLDSKSLAVLKQRYADAFAELGKNERTIPLMRHYAQLMAYHANEAQEGVDILDDVLALPRLKPQVRDEVKLELADLLLFAGEVWDASLLYMQVDKANKDDVLGATAKYKNALLSYYNHDFGWALSQLKVLRGSTSKLIANDAMELSLLISDNMEDDSTYTTLEGFADADLLRYRNLLDSAWAEYEAVERTHLSHPLLDEVLLRKAQIRLKQARYEEADSILNRLVDFYPDDITADDALLLRAELNEEQLGRPDVARQCYERLVIDYPTSLYADRARKKYNQLKQTK